ncbi:MAG: carboxypeptidase regulatory-like domain-containing protein [Kiritimatiellae bacterium]|nr:carboxypeptidase regulatory-like domain-containing protein [Kiritimatiellia bacterium]
MKTSLPVLTLVAVLLPASVFAAGSIRGRVTRGGGIPVEGIWVDAYDQNNILVGSDYTDTNGQYQVSDLAAGDYYVRTDVVGANLIDEWYDDVPALDTDIPPEATVVVVTEGTVSGINFSLAAGGRISGTVTDSTNGPIADAWVDAYELGGSLLKSALSEADGTYAMAGLPAADYGVRTDAGGLNYADEWYDNVVVLGTEIPVDASWVSVMADQTTPNIDFQLADGGVIAGTVSNVAGVLLADVWVDAYDSDENWLDSTATDVNGAYQLQGLPACTVYVRTYAWGMDYADEWYDGVPVLGWGIPAEAVGLPMSAGAVSNGINFGLSLGSDIAGMVTASGGGPLTGVQVHVYSEYGDWVTSAVTGTNGAYMATGLAGTNYYVVSDVGTTNYVNEWYDDVPALGAGIPAAATAVSLPPGYTVYDIDFELSPGGSIAGGVWNETGSTSLVGVAVDVYAPSGEWMDSDVTGATGAYELAGLTSGTYYVRTYAGSANYADEWFDDVPVAGFGIPAGAAPLSITAGGAAGTADFYLSEGCVVAGTVSNELGTLLVGAGVRVCDGDGNELGDDVTGADGTYAVDRLPAGTAYVRTDVDPANCVDEWYADEPVLGDAIPAGASPLTLAAGATNANIDFALTEGGVIQGAVTGAGAPLGGVLLQIFHVYETEMGWVQTEADGSYIVTGLPAAEYFLRTEVGALNYVDVWWDAEPVVGSGIPAGADLVPVVAGATNTGIDFALADGGVIEGIVRDEGANPLDAVALYAFEGGTNFMGSGFSDTGGLYRVLGLPGGTYYVRTDVGGANYADEWYDNVLLLGGGIPAGADGVAVTTGATNDTVDFALAQGGGIAGVITDTGAAPLIGIGVDVYTGSNEWIRSSSSGAGGAYDILGLPGAHGYYVRTYAGATDYADEWYNDVPVAGGEVPAVADQVFVTAGATVSNVSFALAAGGAVTGVVTDVLGTALPDVGVDVYNADSEWVTGGETDADGAYRISRLAPGSYFVRTDVGGLGFRDEWYDDIPAEDAVVPGLGAVDVRVASAADDAEEKLADGTMSLASTDLEMVDDGGDQAVGIRFAGLAVPQGATILAASVQFQTDETDSESTALTVQAQAADDAPAFAATPSNITLRARTGASVAWNPPAWDVAGEAASGQRTPDLSAVIQEVVDRPGWSSGNALALIVTGVGKRTAVSYDGESLEAPLLHVVYATSGGTLDVRVADGTDDAEERLSDGFVGLGSSDLELIQDTLDQAVGIRFSALAVPPGALIRSATIQFKAKDNTLDPTSLTIRGHDTADAPAFTTNATDVTARALTTAAVAWDSVPAWTNGYAGADQCTPDLAPVVQEIVDRADWSSGNALAVVITGSGLRRAWSYDGETNGAPLLHLEYATAADPVAVAEGATVGGVDFALPFLVVGPDVAADRFVLYWQATSGTTYQVEYATNLVENVWMDAPSGSEPEEQSQQTGSALEVLEYHDPTPAAGPAFYRVRVIP